MRLRGIERLSKNVSQAGPTDFRWLDKNGITYYGGWEEEFGPGERLLYA